jgi:hypothetical protein
VVIRYFDGCPHWRSAYDLLVRALAAEGLDTEPRLERVDTDEDAQRLDFVGSPTILVGGRDPFRGIDSTPGLSCRIFQTPEGLAATPTFEQLREALRSD